MKTNILFILPLLICSYFAGAQNYQTITSDRVAYFKTNTDGIQCIRIDSMETNSDSVFYSFKQIRNSDFYCFSPYGPSWIGEKIIIRNNGDNLFFNTHHDTIRIKTNASINDSWISCVTHDSLIFVAEVTIHDTLRFLRQLDSVKTIKFQAYDKNMNPVANVTNDMKLLLSKNFGFVKTVNFLFFGCNDIEYMFYNDFEEYDLWGLSNPKIGNHNLTWYDVFDFQVGDIRHILYDEYEENYSVTRKTIIQILSRTDYLPDSIIYVCQLEQSISEIISGIKTFNYRYDTYTSRITPNPTFDKLPGEPVISDYDAFAYYLHPNGTTKTEPSEYEKIWGPEDSCWSNCCVDGCYPSYTYYKGLGGPFYYCYNYMGFGEINKELVYYKKGDYENGSKLTIIPVIKAEFIDIYPNPVSELIHVSIPVSDVPCFIEILNLNGQTEIRELIDSDESSVHVEILEPGVYMYRIVHNDKMLKQGKLIKR